MNPTSAITVTYKTRSQLELHDIARHERLFLMTTEIAVIYICLMKVPEAALSNNVTSWLVINITVIVYDKNARKKNTRRQN